MTKLEELKTTLAEIEAAMADEAASWRARRVARDVYKAELDQMSNLYNPDNWVVVKISGNDPHYRVLAGWSGSYLGGNSWRMNSGITEVVETKYHYYFFGSSGSTYRCGKDSYMLRMNTAGVWASLQEQHGDAVELMPEDTYWMNTDWIIK
jgi:hypothetical protein